MTDFLLLAFIFLCAGVICVPIATRLGLGSVLGYLIAGILISPLLHLIGVDVIAIQHFAEFGVVMMLFLIGLELEPKLLWDMRNRLIGLGGLQVGLTALAVMGIALYLGQPWTVGLTIGLIFALSSTAIVLQTLNERGLMKSDGGQSSFSVLLFQDIAVIPMLAIIPLLALPEVLEMAQLTAGTDHGEGGGLNLSLVEGLNAWQQMLVTLGAIAAVFLIGTQLTEPLFRFISAAHMRELFTAGALFVVIGIALIMSLVDLSPALGTFIAGVVLANSAYRHELESDIDPFKGLLLGVFFMTVGAGINFVLLAEIWEIILLLTVALIALKAAILYGLARLFKLEGRDRWLFTLGLAQAGEFGFVLISYAVGSNALPSAIADQLLLIVALSMLLTPALFILYDKVVGPYFEKRQPEQQADDISPQGKVIIAGHGRFGGIINRMMRMAGFETTVIDFSSAHLENLRAFGFHVYFGDATRPDLLVAAGIENAKVLVIAIDEQDQINMIVEHVVRNYPHVHIIARAKDRHHVYQLWSLGCRDIIRETYDSSIRAGRSAFEAMGHSRGRADDMASYFEDVDRRMMVHLASLFDNDTPAHLNEPYVAKAKELNDEWERQLRGDSPLNPEKDEENAPDTPETDIKTAPAE